MLDAAMILFGVLTIIAGCGVVFSRKTLHSALWLIVALFLVATHYAMLGADLIAVLQVMVYAGAIMVLVIFVVMLLGLNETAQPAVRLGPQSYFAGAATAVFVAMLLLMVQSSWNDPKKDLPLLAPVPAEVAVTSAGIVPLNAYLNASTDVRVGTADASVRAIGNQLFTKFLYPFEVTSILLLAGIIGAVILAVEPKRLLPPGRGLRAKRNDSVIHLSTGISGGITPIVRTGSDPKSPAERRTLQPDITVSSHSN